MECVILLEATAQKTAPCKVCLCRRAVPGRVYWRERPGGGAGWPAARARLRGTAPDPSALRTSRCCSDSSMARMTSIICPFAASDMEQTRPGRRRFSRDCALRRRLCQTSIVSLWVCTQHQRLRSRRCVSTPPPANQPLGVPAATPAPFVPVRLKTLPACFFLSTLPSSLSLYFFFSSPPSLSILHRPSRPPASPPLPPSVARSRGRPLLTASHRSRLGKRKTNRRTRPLSPPPPSGNRTHRPIFLLRFGRILATDFDVLV